MPFSPRALPIGTFRSLSAGSYSLSADDAVLLCDCTAGNIFIDLHKIAPRRLHRVNIVKSDPSANLVIVHAFLGDTIEGGLSLFFTLTDPHTAVEIVPDGINSWWIIADATTVLPPVPPPPPPGLTQPQVLARVSMRG